MMIWMMHDGIGKAQKHGVTMGKKGDLRRFNGVLRCKMGKTGDLTSKDVDFSDENSGFMVV
jgi:hypothetical protein